MAGTFIKSRGRLLAAMLAGSWRLSPTRFECSAAELEDLAPLLLRSGAAALGWRQVRDAGLRDLAVAQEFHQAYRLYTLHAAVHQRTILEVFALLRGSGIEPILIKGWAIARLYPEPGLRPYGDIDLCVPPRQFAEAEAALRSLGDERHQVDLHQGLRKFDGESWEKIVARSQVVRVGETDVRVLSAEDHLRVLCVHMLLEGAWRPIWLCDIGAAVESLPANFDWDRCLSQNPRLADWTICAISLARELLGADLHGAPVERRTTRLPGWLVRTILKEWASEFPSMPQRHMAPMSSYLRFPGGIWKGFRQRWPNPIEATAGVRGPFNDLPRLPFQLGNCVARTTKFATRLPKLLRER